MTDAEALQHALLVASDCIDVESHWQLEIRYRGLPEGERHQIEAHLERLSMEMYQRATARRPRSRAIPTNGGGAIIDAAVDADRTARLVRLYQRAVAREERRWRRSDGDGDPYRDRWFEALELCGRLEQLLPR